MSLSQKSIRTTFINLVGGSFHIAQFIRKHISNNSEIFVTEYNYLRIKFNVLWFIWHMSTYNNIFLYL